MTGPFGQWLRAHGRGGAARRLAAYRAWSGARGVEHGADQRELGGCDGARLADGLRVEGRRDLVHQLREGGGGGGHDGGFVALHAAYSEWFAAATAGEGESDAPSSRPEGLR